jgi:ornithine cyclodeaminase/alanine dehydrogenase-like protein (mu-crystallin family)
MTLVLNNEEIVRLLPMELAIEALEPAYCDLAGGEAISPARRDLLVPLPGPEKTVYEFKSMPSLYPRKAVAAWRVNSDFLSWQNRAGTVRREKVPKAPGGRYVGLVFLFSMKTGELISIFPDGEIQRIRVGAANAIAAKRLARPEASTIGLLGSGFQAGAQLQGMRAVRPIRYVRVFSPNPEHRNDFAREWTEKLRMPVEPVASGREAVEGADIVIAATNSAQPVFDSEWLRPGMFVTSIRPYELDRLTLERCDVIVIHSRESEPHSFVSGGNRHAVPELAGGGAKAKGGVIDWIEHAELGEMLLGKAPSRSDPKQITCFVNTIGLGLQFAACGAAVYECAREQGLGRELPREWFTEDEHP